MFQRRLFAVDPVTGKSAENGGRDACRKHLSLLISTLPCTRTPLQGQYGMKIDLLLSARLDCRSEIVDASRLKCGRWSGMIRKKES